MANNKYKDNVAGAAAIFAEYGDFIYQVALFKLNDDEDLADDLFQNFFLALVSRPVPDHITNVKGYLYRALNNDCVDLMRRINSRKKILQKYAKKTDLSINVDSFEDALCLKEQDSKLFEILRGKLNPSEFKAIELRYRNGYSVSQTAEKMDVKKASVSRYVSVGLKKIQDFLKIERKKSDEWL